MYSSMTYNFNIEDLVGRHLLEPLVPINKFPTLIKIMSQKFEHPATKARWK